MKEFIHAICEDVEISVAEAMVAVQRADVHSDTLYNLLKHYDLQYVTSAAICSCNIIAHGNGNVLLSMEASFVLDDDRYSEDATRAFEAIQNLLS